MPTRSTPFQRMVFHIQRQMAPSASVDESLMLVDRRSGDRREVDVVIRSRVGEHEVVVSVECREQKRKATVEWVEQMIMKHADLATDKLVLVSASGFSAAALRKADSLQVDALSLEATLDVDWPKIVGRAAEAPFRLLDFRLLAVTLVTRDHPDLEVPVGPETKLFSAAGDDRGSLRGYLDPLLGSWETFGEDAAAFVRGRKEGRFGLEIRPKHGLYAQDTEHRMCAIASVCAYIEYRVSERPIPLSSGAWRGSPIAYGTTDSSLGEIAITVLEPREGVLLGAATIPDPDSGEAKTISLEQPQEPSAFRLVAQGGSLGSRTSQKGGKR